GRRNVEMLDAQGINQRESEDDDQGGPHGAARAGAVTATQVQKEPAAKLADLAHGSIPRPGQATALVHLEAIERPVLLLMAVQGGKGALQEAIFVHGRLVIPLLLVDQPALELVDADQEFFPQGIEKGEALLVPLLDTLQVNVIVELGLGEIEQGLKA